MKRIDFDSTMCDAVAEHTGVRKADVEKVAASMVLYLAGRASLSGKAVFPSLGTVTTSVKKVRVGCDMSSETKVTTKFSFARNFVALVRAKTLSPLLALMLCLFSVSAPADAFTRTPLLIGDDAAISRIIIYHSLACNACAALEIQVGAAEDWLRKNSVAVEFRLVVTDDLSLHRSMFVMGRALGIGGSVDNTVELFINSRRQARFKKFSWGSKKLNAVSSWLEWYAERAKADGVELPASHPLGPGVTTPTSFVLYRGKPIARIETGVSVLDLIVLPLLEAGYVKQRD